MSDSAAEASPTEGMARRVLERNEGNLLEQVAREFWPTPCAADDRDRGHMDMPAIKRRVEAGKQIMLTMAARNAVDIAPLNPAWVECLMGLPVGWTSDEAVRERAAEVA